MKGNLRTIGLITLAGASMAAAQAPNARAANVVSQELKNGEIEPEFFQVPADHAAMHEAAPGGHR